MTLEFRNRNKREGVRDIYVNNRRVGYTCDHCGTNKIGLLYKLRGRIGAYLISKGLKSV